MTIITLPVPTEWDLKHLESCAISVRVRRLIELGIVRKLVADLIAAGYVISVDDGEDTSVKRSTDVESIIDAAFAVDDCTIIARTDHEKGWIHLVYGNDGWDVISNYTTNLEAVLKATNDYAEAMSAWC